MGIKHNILLLLSGLLLLGCALSCNKAQQSVQEKGSVSIMFKTSDNALTKATGPDEGIKTVRVIIAFWEGNNLNIVKNEKRVFNDNSEKKVLNIYDIPVGTYTFYVIANEESLGKEYTDEVLKSEIEDVTGKKKLLYIDDSNSYFPLTEEQDLSKGLPMSGRAADITVSEHLQNISIMLERAVVKINLNLTNNTSSNMELRKISLGKFTGDRLFIFKEGNLDVPSTGSYGMEYTGFEKNIEQGTKRLDRDGGTANYIIYMYPSFAYKEGVDNPYSIGITTYCLDDGETLTYSPVLITTSGNREINSIARNTSLNINGMLNTKATISIDFEVTDWNKRDVIVPPFN